MRDSPSHDVDRRSVLRLSGAAFFAAGVGATAGCLGDDDDTLVITQGELAENADPNDHNATPAYNVFDPVYEPLFRVDAEGEIDEHIVTDWDIDTDTAELTVRDDVTFHNGDDMTAEDVAYTINRQVDPDVGVTSPQVDGLAGITGADAEDDTTVVVEHEVGPGLVEVGLGIFGRVVNEDWIEDRDQPISDEMNGTGPYELESFDAQNEAVYTAFDDYWGEEPEFEEVVFQAIDESSTRVSELQTGESDLIVNVPPTDVDTIDDESGVEIRNLTSFRNIFLVMTNDEPPFDSVEFRQAMNYAVDNQEIIDTILGGFGQPMSQPLPEGHFGYNPDLDPYPQDLDQAESLVDDSGYAGEEITLVCPDGRYLNDTEIAETAAADIDELPNVSCSVEIEPFEDIAAAALDADPTTSPDFFLIGWGNPTYDANYGLAPWMVSGQASHSFIDDDIEAAILESQVIEDDDEREEFLEDLSEDIREAAPWVFLHLEESIYGVRDDIDWEPRPDESLYLHEMSE